MDGFICAAVESERIRGEDMIDYHLCEDGRVVERRENPALPRRVPMISYMQVVTVVTGGAEILIILSTPGYKRFSVDTEYSTLENRSIRRWK